MNKFQDAINTIKSNYPPSNYSMLREALDLSIELLDKQIPKKPLEQGNKLSWIEKLLGVQKTYTCPHCYNSCLVKYAPNGRNINSHCYDCGGVLDWSEEE